jgi:outer membrane autotransporter protein
MKVNISPERSISSEAGVNIGHKFIINKSEIQPYIKLAVTNEYVDDNEVKVNGDHFTNDLSGVGEIYQLGVDAQFTKKLAVHIDAGYAKKSEVETPWSANIGVSLSF